jgi:5-methyltetrahydrofolate--homocysteine methyltransferase
MMLYLGGEPKFAWDTVWFQDFMDSPEEFSRIHFDGNNKWWLLHQKMFREAVVLADNDFYVNIPDIMENLDTLMTMRGSQNLCFDIIDEPELVHAGVEKIDDLYFKYYDTIYDIVKDDDGSSAYTVFDILGKGRIAKIQCDFSAMISPEMFREHAAPSLRKQCLSLDHSIYHLDGPGAIKHVEALMEIKELDALQWTCGAGQPDGGCERWYPIYDKVREAGKSLWLMINDGGPKDWADSAKRITERYGKDGIYFLFPVFPDLETAREMMALFG